MTQPKFPKAFVALCKKVTAKRARTVIDHILEHGFITTDELKTQYGYDHPPRAARDVREQGIPLVTSKVPGANGRKIAAYTFGDPSKVRIGQSGGRTALSKRLKAKLVERDGARCAIYLEPFAEKDLQVDHRVPYEVQGDNANTDQDPANYMLLCGSANRAKSWSCEHCANWLEQKDANICRSCYWAYPDDYTHIAMRAARRMDILWTGTEVEVYERLKKKTTELQHDIPAYVKKIIEKNL